MNRLAARINDALPQTQCTRCGYPDCAGYAQAIADGEADIHQCPPGGAEGIERLAAITGRPSRPLGEAFGVEGPRALAVIDEHWCIGCTLCLDACPTDAIVGINKRMHTVIEPHCTGCELCIPVCPVDCISLEVATPGRTGWQAWSAAQAGAARARYAVHKARLSAKAATAEAEPESAAAPEAAPAVDEAAARKRAVIEAALAKARARLAPPGDKS
ncbi:RnfABCDGE type electron transport complex subunit B [Variovorax sp. OV329]|uniref:RnfABCDGE type electron transport complex subunit B n=1 Tax=Variovorax sp. OV329 TaxID=1882825 RepID=UPI0008E52647|nr:RnfABCDGE type electron transport complex subunit B [Variovorax sp. OV329]SFM40942.1 electron transport complex protein RnfB [Variovorax sp. OV329]